MGNHCFSEKGHGEDLESKTDVVDDSFGCENEKQTKMNLQSFDLLKVSI